MVSFARVGRVNVSEWEPATDAERSMRDALRTDDQESYFRILAGVDLLLPVSADALAGLAPLGWGTWSTGGRTHVLAFTSPSALQACLADYTGSARRVAYAELAETWPNLEWWLAVNPGLPIEGYLPAWFVAQLSRGDVRLPKRGPGRETQDLAGATIGGRGGSGQQGGPMAPTGGPSAAGVMAGAPSGGLPGVADAGFRPSGGAFPPGAEQKPAFPSGPPQPSFPPGPQQPAFPSGPQQQSFPPAAEHKSAFPAASDQKRPPGAAAAFGNRLPSTAGGGVAPSAGTATGLSGGISGTRMGGTPGSPVAPVSSIPTSAAPASPSARTAPAPASAPPSSATTPASAPPSAAPAPASIAPGSAPPSAAPTFTSPSAGPAFTSPSAAPTSSPASAAPASKPAEPGERNPGGQPGQIGPGGLPIRTPGGVLPSGLPSRVPQSSTMPTGTAGSGFEPGGYGRGSAPDPAATGPAVPAAYSAPGVPTSAAPGAPSTPLSSGPATNRSPMGSDSAGGALPTRSPMGSNPAGGALPTRSAAGGALPTRNAPTRNAPTSNAPTSGSPVSAAPSSAIPASGPPAREGGDLPPLQDLRAPLPTRTPMAQTPPVPGHIGASPSTSEAPEGLPRRQPGETPPSMAAAAQALSGTRTPPPAETARQGFAPPVVPGTPGADAGHPARTPFATQPAAAPRAEAPTATPRPEVPPATSRPEASASAARPDVPPTGGPSAPAVDFTPANAVERDLYAAAEGGSTDSFLSTLLLATVLVPVADNSRPGSTPGEQGFVFRTEEMDGGPYLVVFTSRDRLSEHHDQPVRTAPAKFLELIRNWPDPSWSFAVNPESPVGAKYPGPQVIALASWAAEAGLGAEPEERAEKPAPVPQRASDAAQHATVMQKAVPSGQVDFYLERGYDRVAGFVHRANEVEHLRTPGELYAALGLINESSSFSPDAQEAHVLRWPAYRPSLYRIPYGGQSEQALRAMDGWVIERPPFRGNGFAPGEGRDVIAEFKVDSVRLPHGAQLWRIDADGTEKMVAIFDADAPQWRKVGDR